MTDNELTISARLDGYENNTHAAEVNVFEGSDWVGSFDVAFHSAAGRNTFEADWDSVGTTAGEFAGDDPAFWLVEEAAEQLNDTWPETFETINGSAADI